jgi:hypothetical protein
MLVAGHGELDHLAAAAAGVAAPALGTLVMNLPNRAHSCSEGDARSLRHALPPMLSATPASTYTPTTAAPHGRGRVALARCLKSAVTRPKHKVQSTAGAGHPGTSAALTPQPSGCRLLDLQGPTTMPENSVYAAFQTRAQRGRWGRTVWAFAVQQTSVLTQAPTRRAEAREAAFVLGGPLEEVPVLRRAVADDACQRARARISGSRGGGGGRPAVVARVAVSPLTQGALLPLQSADTYRARFLRRSCALWANERKTARQPHRHSAAK